MEHDNRWPSGGELYPQAVSLRKACKQDDDYLLGRILSLLQGFERRLGGEVQLWSLHQKVTSDLNVVSGDEGEIFIRQVVLGGHGDV